MHLSFGQRFQQFKPTSISLLSKGGFLIAHRANMAHLPEKNTYAFELELTRQDTSSSQWNKIYQNPLRGVSFQYQDFGNKEILGQGYSLFGHTSFPLIEGEKFGFLDFRIGTGVGIVSKIYNSDSNPKHVAIGSHVNGYVNLRMQWNRYFEHWHIGAGIEFGHFSNSAMKVPNLGLNLPSISLNVGYDLNKRSLYKNSINKDSTHEDLKYLERMAKHLRLFVIGSSKQNLVQYNDPKSRAVIAIQALYSFKISNNWKIDFGLDGIYNGGNRWHLDTVAYSVGRTLQLGVYAGASVHFYRTEFYTGFGMYLRSTVHPYGLVYNRLGFRYHLTEKISALIGIKAHFAVADYLEMGIGYKLKSWKRKPKLVD